MDDLRTVIKRSGEWLLRSQDKNSGGWGEQPGKAVNNLNTAEALIALLDGGVVQAGDYRIQKGVKFLVSRQCKTGADSGSWPRTAQGEGGLCEVPDIVRTSYAVEALIKAGTNVDAVPVKSALDWLLSIRNTDNGWGYRRNAPSVLMASCFALMALIKAHEAGPKADREELITASLKFLVKNFQSPRGSFGEEGPAEAAHTIYATLVLQAARRLDVAAHVQAETQAINWLLDNPDAASKLREERILIDPNEGRLDYSFLFMTDSLLIKVLTDSTDTAHRKSDLARNAMIAIKDKMDGEGGFYGYRVFSWSTAKIVSALSSATAQYTEFPKREPEAKPVAAPVAWLRMLAPLGFAILFLVALIWLNVIKGFSYLQFGAFVVVILSALLLSGALSERGYRETFGNLFSFLKSSKKDEPETTGAGKPKTKKKKND